MSRTQRAPLALESVTPQDGVKLTATGYDVMRRTGLRGTVTIDRITWEALGRPVDVQMTLEAEEPAVAIAMILDAVAHERARQVSEGYTSEHDDEHGLEHILDQARVRLQHSMLKSRAELVEAAACLVAGIEWFDRQAVRNLRQPD